MTELLPITEGSGNKETASKLGISAKTVENHRSHLMRKLCAHNSADLTREAFRLGMMNSSAPSEEHLVPLTASA